MWMIWPILMNLTSLMMTMMNKLAVLCLGFSLIWGLSVPVSAGPVEEKFVTDNVQIGLSILSDATLDGPARTEQFGQFIDDVVHGKKIARFVLGKYARKLDKQVFATFKEAFDVYAKSIYQGNLSKFGGETIVVTGSVDRKPGDAVVSTLISGGAAKEPIKVRWRIRTKNGVSKVIDLEAFGIWLAVQQRSEIIAYIANHGGNVAAATNMLHAKAAAKMAASATNTDTDTAKNENLPQ